MDVHEVAVELHQLRKFLVTAEELHFRRAAEILHIAQPALSHQIHELEAEVGAVLFERTSRKVSLTPAGQALYQKARIVVDNANRALEEARSIGRGDSGTLTIGFISTATMMALPAALRFLKKKIPSASVSLRYVVPGQQCDALHAGQIDIGFTIAEVCDEEFRVRRVGRERLIAALPRTAEFVSAKRVSLERLSRETTIVPERHARKGYFETILGAYRNERLSPAHLQCVREIQTSLVLVGAGLGIALVPESFRHIRLDSVVYRPLTDPMPSVDVSAVWRKENHSPLLRRFINEFIDKHSV